MRKCMLFLLFSSSQCLWCPQRGEGCREGTGSHLQTWLLWIHSASVEERSGGHCWKTRRCIGFRRPGLTAPHHSIMGLLTDPIGAGDQHQHQLNCCLPRRFCSWNWHHYWTFGHWWAMKLSIPHTLLRLCKWSGSGSGSWVKVQPNPDPDASNWIRTNSFTQVLLNS